MTKLFSVPFNTVLPSLYGRSIETTLTVTKFWRNCVFATNSDFFNLDVVDVRYFKP